MGASGGSEMIISNPSVLGMVSDAGIYISKKGTENPSLSKAQSLYSPQISKDVVNTRGHVRKAILAHGRTQNIFGKVFSVNHAYVIFVFEKNQKVLCEISGFQDGAAIFMKRYAQYTADQTKEFFCYTKGVTIHYVVDMVFQFYSSGEYHVERRNCYDFAAFMLSEWFGEKAPLTALQWKNNQVEKVPSMFRD